MLTMASVYSPGLIGEQLDSADGLSFRGEKMERWSEVAGLETILMFCTAKVS